MDSETIAIARAIKIILPDVAAAMMGASPDGCFVTGQDQWRRIGD